MNRRGMVVGVVVSGVLTTACHASSSSPIQAALDNGGLDASRQVTAVRIAQREVRAQDIDLHAAMALMYVNTSNSALTRSCPDRLIRVVLAGSFPKKISSVQAEDLYADVRGRVCAARYLSNLPALPSNLGTLHVPGTSSTGE